MDIGAWKATVQGVTKSDMTEQLRYTHTVSVYLYIYICCAQSWAFPGGSVSKEYILFIYIFFLYIVLYKLHI